MRVRLLAVGGRPPPWAQAAFRDYASRLPPALGLETVRVRLARGRRSGVARAVAGEGSQLLARIGAADHVVALDERGESWSTADLAGRLSRWQAQGRDVVLLAGGPDGLSHACFQRADERWSLSALTLPHALVHIVVAEQLYRAWSIGTGHPYHRA